jgi:hypothetical protein
MLVERAHLKYPAMNRMRTDDQQERGLLLDVLHAVESAPEVIGVGPHLLATGRKQ